MIGKSEISKVLGVTIPVSADMQTAVNEWEELYTNQSSWIKEDTISLELASEISSVLKERIIFRSSTETL